MTTHKLVSEWDHDTVIASGTEREMELVHNAFETYGLRKDKLLLLPVVPPPLPTQITISECPCQVCSKQD